MKKQAMLGLLLILSACATGYEVDGLSGGFSETRLDENIFRVIFKGNSFTSRERASDFLLLRSAELTLENNYQYFVVTDRNSYSEITTSVTPITSSTTTTTTTTGNAYGNATTTANSTTTTTGGNVTTYVHPRENNVIVLLNEKPQEVLAFNAKFVYEQLTQKYDIEPKY